MRTCVSRKVLGETGGCSGQARKDVPGSILTVEHTTCLQPPGVGRPRPGFLPLLAFIYPDPRLNPLSKWNPFFVAVSLHTSVCLSFPQWVLCWKLRSCGQLLNVFWVLCSLEIATIMPIFLPPDFRFYTLFLLQLASEHPYSFMGQHFKPLPKLQMGPTCSSAPSYLKQTPISYCFLYFFLCVIETCVWVRDVISSFLKRLFGFH